ncbi:MAG: EcsC family protein [Desulfovibrionaceae bacterium]|nr:EcsC family protein [Desulfovibrionaceae bacterium]MBF0515071.1 EcsC family protein [Desulfovibrionaceae bacterium]
MRDPFSEIERGQLVFAHRLLESRPLSIRICDTLGMPVDALMTLLPQKAVDSVQAVTRRCLDKALSVALKTLDREPLKPSRDRLHKGFVLASGFAGGLAGFAGLALEAPVATVAMLRSIADIARSEGARLNDPETMLECLQVFALSGGTRIEGALPGYYAVRGLLSRNLGDAVAHLTTRTLAEESSAVLARFVASVAERFSVNITEKFAAQSAPLLGAAGGATVNYIFISHFQDIARGHFTVKRLEAAHGAAAVQEAYRRLSDDPDGEPIGPRGARSKTAAPPRRKTKRARP